jgi:hypothetical protein
MAVLPYCLNTDAMFESAVHGPLYCRQILNTVSSNRPSKSNNIQALQRFPFAYRIYRSGRCWCLQDAVPRWTFCYFSKYFHICLLKFSFPQLLIKQYIWNGFHRMCASTFILIMWITWRVYCHHITEVLKQKWGTGLLKCSITDSKSTVISRSNPCPSFMDITGLRLVSCQSTLKYLPLRQSCHCGQFRLY